MNGITYRRLTKKDVSAVEKLERECFSDPWSEAMLTGAFGSEFFIGFGAFDGDTPVGYALATAVYEDAETDDIAVKESYRRRGASETGGKRGGKTRRDPRVFRSARGQRGGDCPVRKQRI